MESILRYALVAAVANLWSRQHRIDGLRANARRKRNNSLAYVVISRGNALTTPAA
jgi:hypothetical protein